jgi:hypothetical protein
MVFLIGVREPIVIREFSINDNFFYDAVRKGKPVKLPFQDLKEIRFLNPGKNFETEVLFKDGRRETYLLQPASDIKVFSKFSVVDLGHSKVARIEFSPMPMQPPLLDTLAAVYAASGRYAEARSIAAQGLDIANARGDSQLADRIRRKIEIYQNRRE